MSLQRQNPHSITMKSTIFLHCQIENQESIRQESVSDCSERSCADIWSNWMLCALCCDDNFHLIWMRTSWINHYCTDPIVIQIHIWVKFIFSCRNSYWFLQISSMKKKIQKWSLLICSPTSNEIIKSDLFLQIFMISCVNILLVKVEPPAVLYMYTVVLTVTVQYCTSYGQP